MSGNQKNVTCVDLGGRRIIKKLRKEAMKIVKRKLQVKRFLLKRLFLLKRWFQIGGSMEMLCWNPSNTWKKEKLLPINFLKRWRWIRRNLPQLTGKIGEWSQFGTEGKGRKWVSLTPLSTSMAFIYSWWLPSSLTSRWLFYGPFEYYRWCYSYGRGSSHTTSWLVGVRGTCGALIAL